MNELMKCLVEGALWRCLCCDHIEGVGTKEEVQCHVVGAHSPQYILAVASPNLRAQMVVAEAVLSAA
jgi:hypothetical protein